MTKRVIERAVDHGYNFLHIQSKHCGKGPEGPFPMNITLMVISIYIRMKLIVALYRGVQFFSHVRMDPTLPGFNQYCRELMCLAQGHNKVTHVGIETRTSLFGVPHSTTTPSRKHVRVMYTP